MPAGWALEAPLAPTDPTAESLIGPEPNRVHNHSTMGSFSLFNPTAEIGRHRTQWASAKLVTWALSTGHNLPWLLTASPRPPSGFLFTDGGQCNRTALRYKVSSSLTLRHKQEQIFGHVLEGGRATGFYVRSQGRSCCGRKAWSRGPSRG